MSVIRTKHNREFPYVVLNKQPLFDSTISFKAKGLWAQCLARPTDWSFEIKEMLTQCKEGRDALYSAINELIEKRYAISYQPRNGNGSFADHEYIIYEFQMTEEEQKAEIEKHLNLKEFLPHTGFPEPGNPEPVPSAHTYIQLNKESTLRDDASAPLFEFFWNELRKVKPTIVVPTSSKNSLDAFRSLLAVRTEDKLRSAILWALKNEFWASRILTPQAFSRNFNTIESQMANQRTDPTSVSPEENRRFALDLAEQNQNENLIIDLLHKYVEIFEKGSLHADCIDYTEKDFKGRIIHCIQKRNICLDR